MSQNLYSASRQWAERPSDERFWTLLQLRQSAYDHFKHSATREVDLASVRTEAIDGDVQIVGRKEMPTRFTHYSFGQLCNRVGAPASYIRSLPATLASQNLNVGLKRLEDRKASMLLHSNGVWHVQAFLSTVYQRIWNYQVCDWLLSLPSGWRVPPARLASDDSPGARRATRADILSDEGGGSGLSVSVGDMIAPAGLYASDHDMFAFLVNESQILEASPGGRESLLRGFFCRNSEVGDAAFSLVMFYYEHVCGNHIVWGARDVMTFSIRHVGERARSYQNEATRAISRISAQSMAEDRARIIQARAFLLGQDRGEVIDLVWDKGVFSRRRAEEVYAVAERYADIHGNPRSAWGYAAGATRLSQSIPYADERMAMDRAAQKVLALAW